MCSRWWGHYQYELNQTGTWRVGGASLAITRLKTEWQIQHQDAAPVEKDQLEWSVDLPGRRLGDDAALSRYLFSDTSSGLIFQPALADRPVVSRPVAPLHISPGVNVTIFVSSPLWIVVRTAQDNVMLVDMPNQRPSDTWFGPSTWEGELCYSVPTRARLNLADLQLRAHRAVTGISIHNQGKQVMLIERLMLPLRHLNIYSDEADMLWTSDVTIETDEDMAVAELRIDSGVPSHAGVANLVADRRDPAETHRVRRALNAIFS